MSFRWAADYARDAVVNGGPGAVTVVDGEIMSVLAFTVVEDLIVEIDVLADPDRLAGIDLSVLA
jgi:RNA polymerase sigma-70 factor (ECF subfamily)